MQWGIRKRDPLAIDICKDLVKKMEMEEDPVSTFSVVIDSIRIDITYGAMPDYEIQALVKKYTIAAHIINLETNDEIDSGLMYSEDKEELEKICEKILVTAYLIRK